MKYLSCILLIILIFTFVCVDEAYAGCIDTDSYDAFGILIKIDSDSLMYIYRDGQLHQGGESKIVKRNYTISTGNWSNTADIYLDLDYGVRGVGGGIIGDKIHLFFAREDISYPYIRRPIIHISSTNLTGDSWSAPTELLMEYDYYNAYGAIIPTDDPDTFLQTFCEHNGIDSFKSGLFKTDDGGLTWSVNSTIASSNGTTQWLEPSAAYIGDGKIVCHLRDDAVNFIGQSVSSDNGETWSEVSLTNLGDNTGDTVVFLYYDSESGDLIEVFHDRSIPFKSKITYQNANVVYSNSIWPEPTVIDYGFEYNGYYSIAKIETDKYFVVYSKEQSISDADLWYGTLDLNNLPDIKIDKESDEITPSGGGVYFGGGSSGGSAYGNKRTTSLWNLTSHYYKVCEDVDVESIDCKFTLKIDNQTELKNKFGQLVAAISIEKIDDTYKVKPDGATFNPPATISMECENEHYKIAYFDGEWIKLDSTLENGVISASISIISSLYSLVFDETEMWGYPYWWWRQFNLPNDEIW